MLDQIIKFALKEDIGEADHSTLACVPKEAIGSAKLLIKEPGIIAGVEVAKRIYELYDPSLKITQLKKDGDRVEVGDIAFTVSGFSQSTPRLPVAPLQPRPERPQHPSHAVFLRTGSARW